jgi:hypothetical protein
MLMCEPEAWRDQPGVPVLVLSNGSYTTGKLRVNKNGTHVLLVPNPNCKWRDKHDHAECDKMKDLGVTVL